ncbi:hypothetical protein R6Q59_014166 [Mikania micrantha]
MSINTCTKVGNIGLQSPKGRSPRRRELVARDAQKPSQCEASFGSSERRLGQEIEKKEKREKKEDAGEEKGREEREGAGDTYIDTQVETDITFYIYR